MGTSGGRATQKEHPCVPLSQLLVPLPLAPLFLHGRRCCTNYRTDSSWKNNSHSKGYADGQTESVCCSVSSPIPFNPVILHAVFDLFFGSFGLNASSRTSLLEIFCYAIAARGLMQGSGEDSWNTLKVGIVRSHVNGEIRMLGTWRLPIFLGSFASYLPHLSSLQFSWHFTSYFLSIYIKKKPLFFIAKGHTVGQQAQPIGAGYTLGICKIHGPIPSAVKVFNTPPGAAAAAEVPGRESHLQQVDSSTHPGSRTPLSCRVGK